MAPYGHLNGWSCFLVLKMLATYQRTMNAIFHSMLGHHMEVYIDDIIVKSKRTSEHANHLRKSFERT